MNSSLMKLYRSPSQSLVTAAVTPILRSALPTADDTKNQEVLDSGQASSENNDHDHSTRSLEDDAHSMVIVCIA